MNKIANCCFAPAISLALVFNFNRPAHAAAQMQDAQDYPAAASTGTTTGRAPWIIASSGALPTASSSYIGIFAGDLTGSTTPSLAPLTNTVNPAAHLRLAKAGTGSRTYYRSIGTGITSGSVYYSFLLNVSVNPTLSDEIMATMIATPSGYATNPATTDPLSLHAKNVDATHFTLGIASLGGTVSWASSNLLANTDYLVVLQYTFGAGQSCQMFLNPTPGTAQPSASAIATKGATAEPTDIGTVLFWESSSATSGTYNYDSLRVDAAWNNVTPTGAVITPPPSMRLLFLGNSLLGISTSYSNDIPALMVNLAQNLGDSVTQSRVANSAWYLSQFVTDSTSTNLIASGNFDLVILQEQSERPSLPHERDTAMFPACRSLNQMITNHAEKTMFYETWAYIDGDTSANCASYDIPAQYKVCDGGFGSFLSMNIATRYAYTTIGGQLGAAISPVGLAWARERTEKPGLNLYVLDDGYGDRHPNSEGAYLAACLFYSAIFGRSPEGSTFYSTNSVADCQYFQQLAASIVLQDPFAVDAYGFGTNHYYWSYRWQDYSNPTNSPPNTTVITGASAHPSPSVKVDTAVGAVSNVTLGVFDTNYTLTGQGRLYLYNDGSLTVSGSLTVGADGKGFVQQYGGNLKVGGAMTLGQFSGGSGQYTLTNGSLNAAQILRGTGNSSFAMSGGQLSFGQFGSPSVPFDLAIGGGTLSVSNALAPTFLYGNYYPSNNATLQIQLGSTNRSLVVSNGVAKLSGTLTVGYDNGFQPVAGQQFVLLSAPSMTGAFSQITLPTITSNGIILTTSLNSTSLLAKAVSLASSLASPHLNASKQLQFTLSGQSGYNYAVQRSTNLAIGNWTTILTNSAPFTFTDTNSQTGPQTFYRAILVP